MSYYHAGNAKQRSTGFVIVLFMHIVAIYVLANSFAVFNKEKIVEAIEAEIVEAPPPEQEVVVPLEPTEIKTSVPDFVPPPILGFATEAAPADNAIRQVQHAVVTNDVSPTLVKAKRSSKGLTHPKYPEEAARLGEQGTTELNLNIAVSGDVLDAKLISSSGSPRLDDAIMTHAVRHWRFTPCMDHGQAVQCWNRFTFHWNIENAKKKGTWKSVVASSDE
jgi:periplasmic protein TonB